MLGLQVQNVYKFPFVVLEFVSVPHDQNLFILVCNFMGNVLVGNVYTGKCQLIQFHIQGKYLFYTIQTL